MQHTAAHYSTLQHPAAPCSTLQHPAATCSTLQHTATQNEPAQEKTAPADRGGIGDIPARCLLHQNERCLMALESKFMCMCKYTSV